MNRQVISGQFAGQITKGVGFSAGTECPVALLINFGRPRLEFKRLFPPKKIARHRRKKWGKKLE